MKMTKCNNRCECGKRIHDKDEIKNKKILSEQGGKPIIDNNLGFVNPKATELWSNQ